MLAASSVIYLCASYALTELCGSTGLILANCVNMAIRIVSSLMFIRNFFLTTLYHPLRQSLLSMELLVTFIITLLVTTFSEVVSVLVYMYHHYMALYDLGLFLLWTWLVLEISSHRGGAHMLMLLNASDSVH